ncbi:MAG: HEAT repeat domain-containing protein, partial [Candidatus Omnitrophica bacterium]|nr:HEAT repeat domain-containing protein [Candidatus Omnitrophota bacterium]
MGHLSLRIILLTAVLVSVSAGNVFADRIDELEKQINADNYDPASEELGKIHDPRAVDFLISVVKDNSNNSEKRIFAIYALCEPEGPRDPRAVEPLIELLEKDPDNHIREHAVEALRDLEDPRALKPLIVALSDEEPKIAASAAAALGGLAVSGGIRDEKAV